VSKNKEQDKKALLIIVAAVFGFIAIVCVFWFLSNNKKTTEKATVKNINNQEDGDSFSDYFTDTTLTDEELLESDPFRDVCEGAGASEDHPVFVDGTYCFR
jgi:hypothetical protein